MAMASSDAVSNTLSDNVNDELDEQVDGANWVNSSRDLPQLSRLPSYATTDPNTAPSYSASTRSAGASQTYEILHAKPGLTITRLDSDEVLYYIGRYSRPDMPDVVVYAGPTSKAPVCAQGRLTKTRDVSFLVGSDDEKSWSTVSCVSDGRFFSSDSYHFSSIGSELAWKQTHDTHLGSGKFRSKDYKLVNKGGDTVYAVFLDSGVSDISSVGRLEFRRHLEPASELAAIVILMTLRERLRRHQRQSGLVNRSQDVALRHAIDS